LAELQARLQIEQKIKDGAENLLSVVQTGDTPDANKEGLRKQVASELQGANSRIAALEKRIAELSNTGELRTGEFLVLVQCCYLLNLT
jgi:rapamycin-insensitive companion of mTOR